MSDPKLVYHGENITGTVWVDDVPQGDASVLMKSLKVSQDAVMHQDDYLGQKRSKPDKQLKGYKATMALNTANMSLINALIARDEARERNERIPKVTVGWRAIDRSGATTAYFLDDMEASFDLDFGGRTEPVASNLEFIAADLKRAV
jgi:hypothetical protein